MEKIFDPGGLTCRLRDQRHPWSWRSNERALRREWRFERIGWGVIALVLVAGSVGLFGDGRLASASASTTAGGAVVHYERVVRHGAPSEISLRLAPAAGADTIAIVSLDED